MWIVEAYPPPPQSPVIDFVAQARGTQSGGATFCQKAFTLHSAEISWGEENTLHPFFCRKCFLKKGSRVATKK